MHILSEIEIKENVKHTRLYYSLHLLTRVSDVFYMPFFTYGK